MNVLTDSEAINHIIKNIDRHEANRSSHWVGRLKDISINDGKLSGLTGFGFDNKRSLHYILLNHFLQRPYRKLGAQFPTFPQALATAKGIAKRHGALFDVNRFRMTLTLAFLEQYVNFGSQQSYVGVIGDGIGNFTNIFLGRYPDKKIAIVNLSPMLLLDMVHIRLAHPNVKIGMPRSGKELEAAKADPSIQVIAIQADNHILLQSIPLHLVINTASMQEMHPDIVAEYFTILRNSPHKPLYFYCCNRVEKALPDGEVTRFYEYPWEDSDEILVDEPCPWHQTYYQFFPPKHLKYDGPIQHRLAIFK